MLGLDCLWVSKYLNKTKTHNHPNSLFHDKPSLFSASARDIFSPRGHYWVLFICLKKTATDFYPKAWVWLCWFFLRVFVCLFFKVTEFQVMILKVQVCHKLLHCASYREEDLKCVWQQFDYFQAKLIQSQEKHQYIISFSSYSSVPFSSHHHLSPKPSVFSSLYYLRFLHLP